MTQGPIVSLVAGASRGIGRGAAIALGEIGATVIVTGRSSEHTSRTDHRPETIEETSRLVEAAGGRAFHYRCDHTNEREVDQLVSWTLRRFGRIDVAVSAVWSGNEGFDGERYADGSSWGTSFWRRPAAGFGRAIEGGAYAGLLLARAVAPPMVAMKNGLMVFVTFDANGAYLGDPFYDLGKAATNRLAFVSGTELKPHGVTALALSPGFVRTERVIAAGQGDEAGETPLYAGRAVAALAQDSKVNRFAGQMLHVADLAETYGFTDVDGSCPGRFVLP